MNIYVVRVFDHYTVDGDYNDSYWFSRTNAENRIEDLYAEDRAAGEEKQYSYEINIVKTSDKIS